MKTADLPTRIFLSVTFIVMVAVNYLANALPLNGRQTGEVSDTYGNLFAPAGLTFSIWGVIYLLLALHVLYQWGLFHAAGSRNGALLQRVGVLFSFSSLANTAWVFAWHYEIIWLSMLLIVTILALLAMIVVALRVVPLDAREMAFARVPFSVYFGWLTVAVVANVTAFLVSIGFDGLGIAEPVWAMLIIVVAAAIGTTVMVRNRDIAYGLVLIWAFIGIVIKHQSSDGFAGQYPEVIWTTAACLVGFVVAEVFVIRHPRAPARVIKR